MMEIKAQSVVKPHEDSRHREDRIRIDNPNFIALADGAGGQGLFAGEWADYLLAHIPETPIKTAAEFVQWHNSIKEAFYNQKLEEVKQQIPDMLAKFEREGSLSTLLVMWYVPEESKTYMLSCGDSALFVKTKSFWSSISYPEFMNNPHLISCINEYPEARVFLKSDDYFETGTYLLCSDALAQYIQAVFLLTHPGDENEAQLKMVEDDYVRLSQYTIDLRKAGIAKLDFELDLLQKIRSVAGSEEEFKTCLYQLYDQKLLNYDDYSLIMIN
jgi:hypothetical protein